MPETRCRPARRHLSAPLRPDPDPRRAGVRGRLLAWLCVVLYALQWACAPHDHHDAPAKARHCVACTLHAQAHPGPPPAAPALAPVRWRVAYRAAVPRGTAAAVPLVAYLLPPAQAPPRCA